MTPFNPDGWLDAVVLVIIALIAAVPSWFAARNHTLVKQVKDQVVNGHTTPMRADLDAMREDITGMRDEMRGGFASLRSDINEERQTRRAEDRAIRDEIARHHS